MHCNAIYGVVLRENQHVARDALPGYSLFVPKRDHSWWDLHCIGIQSTTRCQMHPLDGLRRRDLCERGRVLYFRPRVLLVRAANLFDGVQPRSLLTVAGLRGRELRRGKRDFIERQVMLGMRNRDVFGA